VLEEKKFVYPVTLEYSLYLPEDYQQDATPFPLVMFLHGMGERGSLEYLKRHGLPKKIANGEHFPFVIVSPVCHDDSWWTIHMAQLNALLDEIIQIYNIDEKRVYLTGLSMGGYGTWELATMHPEKFAAVAPICGGGMKELDFPQRVCNLKDTPVWTFHGAKDEIVPIGETEILVETLEKCGGNVKFTIYPDVGHDSWTQTYDNPELYDWLLSHSL
jgi:predicted peptidase